MASFLHGRTLSFMTNTFSRKSQYVFSYFKSGRIFGILLAVKILCICLVLIKEYKGIISHIALRKIF